MNTIADSFSEPEFIVKDFVELPSVKLTEIIKKKKVDFDSHWEKFKASQCRFMKNKKNKLVVSKKMTTDNSEIIATNATFGKTHIYDYDGEEVVGTKADFRCFSSILDDNCELIADYNFKKYFEHVDLVNREEEKRQQGLSTRSREEVVGARRFRIYSLSKEYLKENYGIEIETTTETANLTEHDATTSKSLSLEQNISEFSDMIDTKARLNNTSVENENVTSAKSVVSCDSGFQSMVSRNSSLANHTLESIAEEEETGREDMQLDKELTEYNLAQKSLLEEGLRPPRDPDNPDSLDEGISIRSPSIQSPMYMSETGSEINLDMIFKPGTSTMFQNILNNMENGKLSPINYEQSFNKSNLFWIDHVYLKHQEDFELPFHYLLQQASLDINFLGLPAQKVRRRCLFALPPEDFKSRTTYVSILSLE